MNDVNLWKISVVHVLLKYYLHRLLRIMSMNYLLKDWLNSIAVVHNIKINADKQSLSYHYLHWLAYVGFPVSRATMLGQIISQMQFTDHQTWTQPLSQRQLTTLYWSKLPEKHHWMPFSHHELLSTFFFLVLFPGSMFGVFFCSVFRLDTQVISATKDYCSHTGPLELLLLNFNINVEFYIWLGVPHFKNSVFVRHTYASTTLTQCLNVKLQLFNQYCYITVPSKNVNKNQVQFYLSQLTSSDFTSQYIIKNICWIHTTSAIIEIIYPS